MEKYLFGLIGILLLGVVGIGAYAVSTHPAETANLAPTAVGAVGEAVSDVTGIVSGSTTNADASANVASDSSDDDSAAQEAGDDNENETPAAAKTQTTQTTQTKQTTQTTQKAGVYTMAQVQAHNSASSCYTVINGTVYDLTSFIPSHPGGSRILVVCGKDGTSAFEAQHGGDRRPEAELAKLKIGVLSK